MGHKGHDVRYWHKADIPVPLTNCNDETTMRGLATKVLQRRS